MPARAPRLSFTDLQCPSCGYDLRGLRRTACPECGRRFVPHAVILVRKKAGGRALGLVSAVVLFAMLVAWGIRFL